MLSHRRDPIPADAQPLRGAALDKYRRILTKAEPTPGWQRIALAVKFHRPMITMLEFPTQCGGNPSMYRFRIMVQRGTLWYSDGSSGNLEYAIAVNIWNQNGMDRYRKIGKAIQRKMTSRFQPKAKAC